LNGASETQATMAKELETPAVILGLCKAIYRICLEHARERVQGGKPIIQHPTVGSMLTEMAMIIDVQEAYMYDITVCIRRIRTMIEGSHGSENIRSPSPCTGPLS